MKICHVCQFECNDNVELCPLCGADLSNIDNSDENIEEIEEIIICKPVLLSTFDDVISADIFKDILNDNKIPYSSSQDETGSIRVLFGGALVSEEIYVDETDYEKAIELLEEFSNSQEIIFDEEFPEEEYEEN